MSNVSVITAIKDHHSELTTDLQARTAQVLAQAHGEQLRHATQELDRWCRAELLPHAAAEETTIYAAGTTLEPTRLLVAAMIAEHRGLEKAVDAVAQARDGVAAVAAASAAQALFGAHLAKENDLLLPALDSAGVDLAPLLEGMHELLGEAEPAAHAGCGCGCGHSSGLSS